MIVKMRIFDILISVLIFAGFLSSTIAQGYSDIPSGNPFISCPYGIPEYSNIPGIASFPCTMGAQPQRPPPVDNVETFLREKCEENGSASSYDTAKDGMQFLVQCLAMVVDGPGIGKDFADAKAKNQLDTVYKKYCLRTPVLNECVNYAIPQVESCLEENDERNSTEILYNITSKLLEFICENDGTRIAEFVSSGGIQCMGSKQYELTNCANQTFGSYIPLSSYSEEAYLPNATELGRLVQPLVPSSEDCANLDEFQECTVKSLMECEDKTPANLLNSLFNSVKNETPCDNLLEVQSPRPTVDNEEFSISTIAPEHGLSTGERFENLVREKCMKNGGRRAYEVVLRTPQHFSDCLQPLVNVTQLQTEIQIARGDDNLGDLFNEYCRKVPAVKKCVKHVVRAVKPCLEEEEHETIYMISNVTSSFLRFACRHGGERLARFVFYNGLECLNSKLDALQNCATQAFGSRVSATGSGGLRGFDGPLVLDADDCTELANFLQCSNQVLRKCEHRSDANVVGSLIKSLYKATNCKAVRQG